MNKKEIKKMIVKVYKERQAAHDILLACDVFIDNLLKQLLK